uniref:Uncharacterized protein n=1 Tax=Anguilla anguilla TaxID=7936 RepID=A0A0E9TGS1_ANGAN
MREGLGAGLQAFSVQAVGPQMLVEQLGRQFL